jgi:hypothetical protein
MLKFIFWLLLAVNALLWLLGSGHVGNIDGNVRQPARLENQLNAERIALIAAPAAPPAPKPAAPPVKAPEPIACIEIGNFTLPDAARFETQLATLALGERQSRHNVSGPDATNYIVYLPPQGGKEGADKKVAELQRLGIQNYFIMADGATLRWAVSLGVFKSETTAQNLLASLVKRGVHNARIAPRMVNNKLLTFRLRGLDLPTKLRLDEIKAAFPAQTMGSCK